MNHTYNKAELDIAVEGVKLIQHLALNVDLGALTEVWDRMHRADTLMPILDPTLYRDKMTVNAYNQECISEFLRYRAALVRIKADMKARS